LAADFTQHDFTNDLSHLDPQTLNLIQFHRVLSQPEKRPFDLVACKDRVIDTERPSQDASTS